MSNPMAIHGKRQIQTNTIDLGKLEQNFLNSADWDVNGGNTATPGTITGVPDPVNALDVVNLQYLQEYTTTSGNVIGAAEDASYTDGLFTDFTDTTPVGTAVDRFNELFKSLAPSPAPNLSIATSSTSGVSGKLSSDGTHTIPSFTNVPTTSINDSYSVSGNIRGILNGSTAITATLAQNVAPGYANSRPYPNYAFGDADKGSLHLEVNGVVVHTIDLTTFASGSSLNANGSGFNLSAATSVQFDNGNSLDLFKYRTGTLTIAAASMQSGYNTARVRHEYATGLYRDTNATSWVVDSDATATSFSAITFDGLSLTGSKYLSGVRYYTGGTANYSFTISNAYKNTYSSSASAISYTGTNCTATSSAIPTTTSYTADVAVTNKVATINASRLMNEAISIRASVLRTVQTTQQTTLSSISNILLDNVADDATITNETFNGEGFRIHNGIVLTDTSYGSGTAGASSYDWDSTQNLISGNSNHNNGLLVSGGSLTYPKVTSHLAAITNGNFSTPANGYAGNPDYSAASGTRTYYRYFYDAAARSNFRINVTATSTTFVSVATGASANNLTFEVLAPNTTVNGGGTVVWKDAVTPHSGNDTDVGCYAATFGSTIPTNWGATLGTKNTSTSGKVIVVKITASAAWTGRIDNIAITWL
jgi:hypothetical protein